ncbi:B-cell receptor CD22-like [Acanthopagrus latus]|uniref:B-cell receptor CD22-like n=1 Tax=Acanthopagrus latus TaxID=8177 RepID=UPI00187C9841|nr:B-cell receptor CD22-like [Acanthopagrus latus]
MNPTDSGNYSCSLKTHTGTASRVININVEYAPKNTSVSVRPSKEVEAGTNITLICSSHANPPVDYTWFRLNESHVLDVGHQPELFSADGGQYFCSATNKHGGQNSSVVTVKIKGGRALFNRDVLIIIPTVALLLIVITVVAVTRLKKTRPRVQEISCEEDRECQDAVYVNWPVGGKNQSEGRSPCEGATAELVYATVTFHTKRKPNTEPQTDHDDDDDVIYSTVCR